MQSGHLSLPVQAVLWVGLALFFQIGLILEVGTLRVELLVLVTCLFVIWVPLAAIFDATCPKERLKSGLNSLLYFSL